MAARRSYHVKGVGPASPDNSDTQAAPHVSPSRLDGRGPCSGAARIRATYIGGSRRTGAYGPRGARPGYTHPARSTPGLGTSGAEEERRHWRRTRDRGATSYTQRRPRWRTGDDAEEVPPVEDRDTARRRRSRTGDDAGHGGAGGGPGRRAEAPVEDRGRQRSRWRTGAGGHQGSPRPESWAGGGADGARTRRAGVYGPPTKMCRCRMFYLMCR